jgi:SSS family solute:Na+ symporter
VSAAAAVWAGTAALVCYVVVSGIRGSAWTAALKDVLILGVAIGIGVYLPTHYFGGVGPMFTAIERAKPGFLTLPGAGMSLSWFISTVVLSSLGLFMWPHTFASAYTARSDGAFRRNAVLLPLYQLVILFVFLAGFAALLVVPGLTGADADLSLLRIAARTFSPWMVGVIGAAGLLTALVPGSMLLISAATIVAQNVYRPLVPTASERNRALVARTSVPIIAVIAALFAEHGGQTIVTLLLLGYTIVTQLAPALLAAFGRVRWATPVGAIAGICAGEATAVYLSLTGASISTLTPSAPQMMKDLNIGVIALAVNVVVLMVVSLTMGRPTMIVTPGSAALDAA